ncbi:MAG: hypothetical protein AAGJ80_07920, partial [Cyanobacteria bacterium J06553_1]
SSVTVVIIGGGSFYLSFKGYTWCNAVLIISNCRLVKGLEPYTKPNQSQHYEMNFLRVMDQEESQ